jgi:hypothetical protein
MVNSHVTRKKKWAYPKYVFLKYSYDGSGSHVVQFGHRISKDRHTVSFNGRQDDEHKIFACNSRYTCIYDGVRN